MSLAELARCEMVRPGSLEALCALLHQHAEQGPPVVLLAGGTDWLVELGQRPPASGPLPLVVDIWRMAELRGISEQGDRLRIGAGVSYAELQRSSLLLRRAPLLARMAADVGGPPIQARGTLGGNLGTASPAADGVAALAALDATVELMGVRGVRQVPLAELQTGYKTSCCAPDEVIVAVRVRPIGAADRWSWRKIGARRAQAISKVALAATASATAKRVTAVGLGMASVAPTTAHMPATRRLLCAHPPADIDGAALDAAVAQDIAPIDDLRSSRQYRQHCARALVRAFARELGAPV